MPGLGKTTLALMIYKDQRIRDLFPTVIWVNVSQEFNLENVLLTILQKSVEDCGKRIFVHSSSRNIDALSDMVRTHLQRGRFLIILDDVWTESAWEEIEKILPIGKNKQGRVLITTRKGEVAKRACTKDHLNLKVLGENDSWELLQLETFGKLDGCDIHLENIGKKIANKCRGLPLAISVIGSVLSDKIKAKHSMKELIRQWEEVLKTVDQFLFNDEYDEGLKQIVGLSYNSLSTELKYCFRYLAIFPEDTEIPVWKLTQLWIAEGFVIPQNDRTNEDVAYDYVKDLIDRSLLIAAQTKPNGEVKTVLVHDVIRKFCEKESADLFIEIKLSGGLFVPGVHESVDCRRICIHSSLADFFEKKPQILIKARTFLSISKVPMVWDKKKLQFVKDIFNVLRILDVNMAIKFPKFPTDLSRLVLLKYVTISSDAFKVLPKVVYKLCNVQTLEVYTSSPTLSVQANIWKMKQLRHFKSNASIVLREAGRANGAGDNLFTLKKLSPQSCTGNVFNKAKNLKVLGIRGELNRLLESELCLSKLGNLEKLTLVNSSTPNEAELKPLRGIPSCEWFPVNIKVLVLSATHLKWEHMSTLGQITTLEQLKLKDKAFVGHLWNAGSSGFSSLLSLHISDADLVLWSASGEAFVRLLEVVVINCMGLKGLPEELVMKLELLHMERVGDIAISAAKMLEEAIQQKQGKQTANPNRFKLVLQA